MTEPTPLPRVFGTASSVLDSTARRSGGRIAGGRTTPARRNWAASVGGPGSPPIEVGWHRPSGWSAASSRSAGEREVR